MKGTECYGNCRIFFIVSLFFGLFRPASVWAIGVWGFSVNRGSGSIPMLGACVTRSCILLYPSKHARDSRSRFTCAMCSHDSRVRFAYAICARVSKRVFRSACVRVHGRMLACGKPHVQSCLCNRMTVAEAETMEVTNVK